MITDDAEVRFLLSQPPLQELYGGTPPTAQKILEDLEQYGTLSVHLQPLAGGQHAHWCVLRCGGQQDGEVFHGRGPTAYSAALDCMCAMLSLIDDDAARGLDALQAFLAEHTTD